MRDKVILGMTLTVVLLLTLIIYVGVDAQRVPATTAAAREEAMANGLHTYALYCIQCHGPKGEGCIGPALNRDVWRAEINGAANPNFDPESHDFMFKTISRGRVSNQPGIQMPAWSINEGGSLNDQEINNVITFIQYGNWDNTLEQAASAGNLDKDLPAYQNVGYTGDAQKVKQIMLANGCLTCHRIGSVGGAIAADLSDVGSRRTADWLKRWVYDPKAMPPNERGPNIWLVAPTPSLYTPAPNATPAATPVTFPMNSTYMPTLKLSDADLNTLVDYLSHARTTK